jgi:release factor glutamine methyltransferase
MRPAEVVRRGADYLARHGVDQPEVSAEALLRRVLDVDRATLFTREAGLTTAEAKAYGRALCRRCTGVPLQHLTGEQGFHRLVLEVRPGVFVPRPETEVLVDVALGLVGQAPTVADVGTGTGAIALAIAHERPGARVFATDLSEDAVVLARRNAARLGPDVTVVAGDLLSGLPDDLRGSVDLVVANPPYLPEERAPSLPLEVRADPALALFGGPAFAERLAAEAIAWLVPGGALALEIEESTGATVAGLLEAAGAVEVRVHPDLVGRDRVVVGRRPA